MRIAFKICKQGLLALLNIQNVCVKSLLSLVIKPYKKLCKRMIKQLLNSVILLSVERFRCFNSADKVTIVYVARAYLSLHYLHFVPY